MPTTHIRPARGTPDSDLRPALALARMDCAATLSAQLTAVVTEAGLHPRRVAERQWWASALALPGRTLDDGWARLAEPPVRRARARSRSWRTVTPGAGGVSAITPGRSSAAMTAITDRGGATVLADAAAAVLPGPAVHRPIRRRGRPRRPPPGTGPVGVAVSGAALPGSLLSGSVVSGAAGIWRALPGSGWATLLVLVGALLLAGAAVLARLHAVRGARARALAERVGAAVTVAAERELLRRSLAAERAAGAGVPRPDGVVAAVRRGVGRVA